MKKIALISLLLWAFNIHFFYSLYLRDSSIYHFLFESIAYYIAILFLVTIFSFSRHLNHLFINFLFLISIFGAYFIGSMGIEIDGNMLSNIFSSNSTEALELTSITLFLYLFSLFFLLYLLNIKLLAKQKSLPLKRYLSALVLILIIALAFLKIDRDFIDRFTATDTPKVAPLFLIPSISEYVILRERLVAIDKKNISDEFTLKEETNDTLVVFVLGESARGDRFWLNGYKKETNPELSKISNLISFADVSSCHTSTLNSVPCLMTRVLQKEYDITIHETSFVQIFKDLGYETYWYSKHSPQKRVDTFCQEAAVCEYINESAYDQDLVEKLSFLQTQQNKTLVVLHMLGSHLDYNERVPDSLKHFKPLCRGNVSGCTKEELDNSYDNTILYTDRFLAQIIEKLKEKNACLIYTSDHGESLGEGEIVARYGHASPYEIAPQAQKNVPLILWFSDKYLQNHKEINLQKIAKLENISHDNIFDTVLNCGAIHYKNIQNTNLNLLQR